MATEDELTATLDFSSPPVIEVRLSFFFSPILGLTQSVTLPIINQWVSDYPFIEEGMPDTPWDRSAQEFMRNAIDEGAHWPVPLTTITSRDTIYGIHTQEDRFELSWSYDPDQSNPYPGFNALEAELTKRFSDFSEQVETDTGTKIAVQRADATYTNLIPAKINDYCAGVMTGWVATADHRPLPSEYTGLHLRNILDPNPDKIQCVINAHADIDRDATSLVIDARSVVPDGTSPYDALGLAHRVVLTSFERLTSDAMRVTWRGDK